LETFNASHIFGNLAAVSETSNLGKKREAKWILNELNRSANSALPWACVPI